MKTTQRLPRDRHHLRPLPMLTGMLAATAPLALHAQAESVAAPAQSLPAITVQGRADGAVELDQPTDTGSRLGLTARETPASVEVITQETIERRGARTLEEALRGAPGMTTGGGPGSPGVASTRGFTGGFIAYLYDGMRVSTPTMSSRPQDTWNYERIEILKGPASVLFGEGGIGGAVNFVPKQARRDQAGSEALVSLGSYGTARAAVGHGDNLGESGAYRFDYSHNRTDGWIDRSGQRLHHLTGALAFDLNPDLELDLSVDYLQDDIEAYFGTPLVPRDFATRPTSVVSDSTGRVIDKRMLRNNYNVADGLMTADALTLRGRVSWQITPSWRLRNELTAYRADRHWRNAENLSFVAPDRIGRDQVDISHDHEVWGNRLDLQHEGVLAGLKNRFLAGLEYGRTDFGSDRTFGSGSTVDALNPSPGRYNPDPTLAPGPGNRTHVTADIGTTSLFAEDALKLRDDLTLVLGLRHDRIKLDRSITDHNESTYTEFDTRYSANSVRIGSVIDLSPDTALYAQYANAAAPVGTSNLLLLSAANSDFPLTRGKQWEVGLKQSLPEQRIDWTLALYRITQDNVLSRDPDNPSVTVNNGKIASRGLEISAGWRATRQLTLSGNLALVDAEFKSLVETGGVSRVGNRPTNVPKRTANLWLDYRFADLPLTVGTAVQHVSSMYTNTANTVRINGYTLLDVYASWRIRPALLTLRMRNVTDELYGTWAGANANNQVLLGMPRTVELTAKFDF
ncbi:TonB-dependent receptor [Schlegelella sp. S2-27]|uniref:TonB-dependent receptor n=1 Tax=Caldimonas mangrovi TaxID=2944811 RepID=A0ABT0YPH9_9BURK|nr:TonB-dependent receptor [Caldimonas mangrovi]MCM5680648.1 TonB-dependent receptor [Caldimonas mangrovi]